MSTWLESLLAEKQRAVEKYLEKEAVAELRSTHAFIMGTLQSSQVEFSLLELVDQVVSGHPDFRFARLQRVVIGTDKSLKTALSRYERRDEDAFKDWSGWLWPQKRMANHHDGFIDRVLVEYSNKEWPIQEVVNCPITPSCPLPPEHYLRSIDWILDFDDRGVETYRDHRNWEVHRGIKIAVSSSGLTINGESVVSANEQNTRVALVNAFRNPVTWQFDITRPYDPGENR